jgi:cytochrome c biogenesis protein
VTATRERPAAPAPVQPRLGVVGTLRFAWRQLTSMRTALFLLLLLAVAAVPGSVLPQRGVNAGEVSNYLAEHPASGPWIDRLGGFDVYSSVWFSAIYLLLFISLVGCVLPRSRQHWRAVPARPPRTPARLDRLPLHRTAEVDGDPAEVLDRARIGLRRRRFRLQVSHGSVSAERGQLRETGNLVFHLSLVVLLVAVAAGHLLGWRGDVVVPVGSSFANAVPSYDSLDAGPWVDPERLPPFSLDLESMTVRFEEEQTGSQLGAPREFSARVTSRTDPDAPPRTSTIRVNHPLELDGAKVFLLGNGYAPVITVRDRTDRVVYSQPTPFVPQDGSYKSLGAVKAPGAEPEQIGLVGWFLPTAVIDEQGPRSIFPDLKNPALTLTAYAGDLNLASGAAQSVFTLDTSKMRQLKTADGDLVRLLIAPGQTRQLPDGLGSVTFDRVERFAGLSIRHDPARGWALGASVAAMLGLALSLFVPRRRVFVRVRAVHSSGDGGAGRTLVEVAGLSRGEDAGLEDEVARVLATVGASDADRGHRPANVPGQASHGTPASPASPPSPADAVSAAVPAGATDEERA